MKFSSSDLRRWCRILHRDISYIFSGMVIIYALSGIYMNHRDTINPHYTISRTEVVITELPTAAEMDKGAVLALMEKVGVSERYTKHYFPKDNQLKVFLKGSSTLEADLQTGNVVYESLRRRPIISPMTTLHYNPGKWWTWFSDIFAIALIVITITGLVMLKGNKGLIGRGGIELIIGIAIPVLLLIFNS